MWIVFCRISFHQLILRKICPFEQGATFNWNDGGSGLTGTFIPTYKSPMEKFLAVAVKSVGRQWWNKTIFPTTQPQLPLYQIFLPNIPPNILPKYSAQISALQGNKTQISNHRLLIVLGDVLLKSVWGDARLESALAIWTFIKLKKGSPPNYSDYCPVPRLCSV